MFWKIKEAWRDAKGTELRKEVEDSVRRLVSIPDEMNLHVCMHMASGYEVIIKQFGRLENIPADGKLKIAKNLREMAQKSFNFDVARGHGLFLISAYIESQALPGNDAKFVQAALAEMLENAIRANKDARNAIVGDNSKEKVAESADPYFMSELPHPDVNRPGGVFRSGDLLLTYYENPRTVGSVVAGIEAAYEYPQVVVVSGKDCPVLIIRVECSADMSFLCSLDAHGRHVNFEPYKPTDRDSFIKKAEEVIMKN